MSTDSTLDGSRGTRRKKAVSHDPYFVVSILLTSAATILNFLYNHIEHGQDWHIRVRWEPRKVVVYDNRVTQQ